MRYVDSTHDILKIKEIAKMNISKIYTRCMNLDPECTIRVTDSSYRVIFEGTIEEIPNRLYFEPVVETFEIKNPWYLIIRLMEEE